MLAYLDCFSGISGDMTLGALIHLGVPLPWLKESIAGLPLAGFDIIATDVVYNGIRAKRVDVQARGEHHEALLVDTPFYLALAVNRFFQLQIGFLERGGKLRVALRIEIMHLDSLDVIN